jgi:hypothetical protein
MNLRCRIFLLSIFFCCALSPPGFAQSAAGPYTLSANNQCTKPIDATGLSSVGMQITGTSVLTLTPEVSIGGQAPTPTLFTQSTSTTGPVATFTTAGATNAVFSASVAGAKSFLLCVTAYTSGSATIYFQGSNLSAKGIGGGGGGGSYSFFGNTANPLTALNNGTTIVDAAGDSLAFEPSAGVGFTFADQYGNQILTEAGPGRDFLIADVAGNTIDMRSTVFQINPAIGLSIAINGNSGNTPPAAPANTLLDIYGADATATRLAVRSFGATSFVSTVAYGGILSSPTAVTSGTQLGGINAWAYNGTGLNGPIATFRTFANQTQTTVNGGSYADIATTPNGSTTQAEVIRFENDAGITVPSTVTGGDKGAGTLNAANLYVNGTAVNTSNSNVASVFTRTGAVVAASGDYTCAQVTNCPATPITIANGGTNATSAVAGQVPNSTSSSAAGWSSQPTLGANGGTAGAITYAGSTSSSVTVGCAPTTTCGNYGGGSTNAQFAKYNTATNCGANGTAANPSVVSCGSAGAGSFSCATNASAGTCTVNDSAVTANSNIILTPVAYTGTRLAVTCNTVVLTGAYVSAISTGTSFTVQLPTFVTNPECFTYQILN